MKSAREIFKEFGVTEQDFKYQRFQHAINALNQAQIEAIEECAEAVTDFFYPPQGGFTKMSVEDIEALKSNILQLKNQVR